VKFLKGVGQYFCNVLISLDQLGNSVLWFGCPDETISSHLGRVKVANDGKIPWTCPADKLIEAGLNIIQKDHCVKSIEHDEIASGEIQHEDIFDGDMDTKDPL
jgi:hypothetical protein